MTGLLFSSVFLLFNFSSWGAKLFLISSLMVVFLKFFPLSYSFYNSFAFMDILSFSLIFLSFWVTILMVLSSYSVYKYKNSSVFYIGLIYFLMIMLFFSFSSSSLLFFYFFFECSLIPTLLMIMGWGYQPERLQASVYFLFYTLFGSLPLLMLIFFLYKKNGSFSFEFMSMELGVTGVFQVMFFVFMMLAFLIKMPMYLFHLWLPKAHVEAPVAGSMILAGVLLKLGGYGLCRVIFILSSYLYLFGVYVIGLSLAAMVFVGFVCCRLNDLKALIAYSSVAHMGLVLAGLISFYNWGYSGGLMMMVSHGLASSGLFCIVNMYYERISSRSIFLNKGLLMVLPSFGLFMFLLAAANISAPPTINLLSEIFLMFSVLGYSNFMMIMFPLGSFLGAVFTLFMFSYSQHGKNFNISYSLSCVFSRESHTLMCHLFPINLMLLKSLIFLLF